MRCMLAIVALASASAFVHAQTPAAPAAPAGPVSKVTFVDHGKVNAALAKRGGLVSGSDVLVSGSHRDKAGQVEVHDHEMDVTS